MSQNIYRAKISFAMTDYTVRQGEKRIYDDDDLEADLIAAGYIERYDPADMEWGTTDLSYVFYQGNRTGIISDVLSSVGSDPVSALDAMCAYCYYLEEIDVSGLDVSEVTNFNRVFLHCEALTELDLSDWNTSSMSSSEYFLAYTTNLTTLIINNSDRVFNLTNENALEGSAIANGTGYVYVPSSMVNAYKAHAVWGLYADQILPYSALSA